jgi:hypothetical protein
LYCAFFTSELLFRTNRNSLLIFRQMAAPSANSLWQRFTEVKSADASLGAESGETGGNGTAHHVAIAIVREPDGVCIRQFIEALRGGRIAKLLVCVAQVEVDRRVEFVDALVSRRVGSGEGLCVPAQCVRGRRLMARNEVGSDASLVIVAGTLPRLQEQLAGIRISMCTFGLHTGGAEFHNWVFWIHVSEWLSQARVVLALLHHSYLCQHAAVWPR